MLQASDLMNQLISSVRGADSVSKAHSNFASALKNYILQNLEIKGTYTGVMPNGSPDTKNGSYTWKLTDIIIDTGSLLSGASSGLEGWKAALSQALSTGQVLGSDKTGTITLTSPSLTLVASVNIDFSGKPKTMNDAYNLVSAGIVDSIKAGVMNPITTAATSIVGGTGVVTFTELS